jgi:hypothetical protein
MARDMLYYNQQEGRKPRRKEGNAMKFTVITLDEYCKMIADELLKMQAQGMTEEEILTNISAFMHEMHDQGYRLAKG